MNPYEAEIKRLREALAEITWLEAKHDQPTASMLAGVAQAALNQPSPDTSKIDAVLKNAIQLAERTLLHNPDGQAAFIAVLLIQNEEYCAALTPEQRAGIMGEGE